jgi:CRISPR type III-A-associated protein Csm2
MAYYDFKTLVLSTEKNPELFNSTAESIASLFVERKNDARGREKINGVSRHQLRRQYESVIKIRQKIDKYQSEAERENEWQKQYPFVKMIRSQVAYSVARAKQNNRYSSSQYDAFKAFADVCINQINDRETFLTFCNLFEAVYGFYYELGGANL